VTERPVAGGRLLLAADAGRFRAPGSAHPVPLAGTGARGYLDGEPPQPGTVSGGAA